jgi:hypothetical protein
MRQTAGTTIQSGARTADTSPGTSGRIAAHTTTTRQRTTSDLRERSMIVESPYRKSDQPVKRASVF